MFKRNLLLLLCVVLLVLIGIDAEAAKAFGDRDDDILMARADREERHEYDEDDEEHERDDDDEDEEWDDDDEDEDFDDDEEEELEELFEEFVPKALKYLKLINPKLHDHIITEDDEIRREFIDPILHFTRMWMEWEETGEKGIEFELKHVALRFHVDLLVDQYHHSDEKKQKKLRGEIQKLLVKLFDLEIARREYRVAELQKELNELKSQLQKAKGNKEEQIKLYLERLTSKQTIFEW